MDPLHLPGSGMAGIPGLVQAARSGSVAMVNRARQRRAAEPCAGAVHAPACSAGCWARRRCCRTCRPSGWATGERRATALAVPEHWSSSTRRQRNDPGEPSSMRATGRGSPAAPSRRSRAGCAMRGIAGSRSSRCASPPRRRSTDAACVPTPFALRAYVALTRTATGPARRPGAPRRRGRTAARLPNGFGSKDLWVTAPSAGAAAAQHHAHDMREVHLRRTGRDLLSAAPPTICSGSAATPSAPRRPCACCAASSRASSRTDAPRQPERAATAAALVLQKRVRRRCPRSGAGWDGAGGAGRAR